MRIVIDDKIPFIRGEAERLGETIYLPGAAIKPKDVKDADVLIVRTRTRCDRNLLEGSRVQFIATATIGFDHLDTDFLDAAGIRWTNCPGCNATSVAQYVRNALLLLRKDGFIDLQRATVGIVGVGHVGTAVANALRPYGCRLLLCDPPRQERGESGFVSLAQIEAEADVITFHTPLTHHGTHATFHLADDAFFRRLQRRPVIINSGRGEVVETEALKQALASGSVRTAVVDTWENEPDIDRDLLRAVYLGTPHIAGYSADGKANGTRMSLEAVAKHFGLPLTFDIRPPQMPMGTAYSAAALADTSADAPLLRLYDPRTDSEALRSRPEDFERLRGNYPLRREAEE